MPPLVPKMPLDDSEGTPEMRGYWRSRTDGYFPEGDIRLFGLHAERLKIKHPEVFDTDLRARVLANLTVCETIMNTFDFSKFWEVIDYPDSYFTDKPCTLVAMVDDVLPIQIMDFQLVLSNMSHSLSIQVSASSWTPLNAVHPQDLRDDALFFAALTATRLGLSAMTDGLLIGSEIDPETFEEIPRGKIPPFINDIYTAFSMLESLFRWKYDGVCPLAAINYLTDCYESTEGRLLHNMDIIETQKLSSSERANRNKEIGLYMNLGDGYAKIINILVGNDTA